jgi:anti-sigma regulatory factor (Ser/Thr protein kinase)
MAKRRRDGVPVAWGRDLRADTLERPTGAHRKRVETMPQSTAGRETTDDLGDGLVQHHRLDLLKCDEPPGLARRLVRQALSERASATRVDDAMLVTCELVTNALRHTPDGPVRMDLDVYERVAVIWIYDYERDTEAVRSPARGVDGVLAERGRGLDLVEALADRWFVWSADRGKAVVAVMPLSDGGRTPTV